MPTGYTSAVADGKITTLSAYALQCARAFGALITMRDDPSDAPIPEELFPAVYYRDSLIAAQAELARLESLSPADWATEAQAAYLKRLQDVRTQRAERITEHQRYKLMLAQVDSWPVPSDLYELRNFMAQQLHVSMSDDFEGELRKYYADPVLQTPAEFRADRLSGVARNITYHQEQWDKEVERTAERNLWLKQLRDSLPAEEPAAS